jgi:rod shape-determining protein MreC
MIQRTRRQGVIRGSGEGSLELDYIPAQADVRVGDLVVTAGIDGIYPRGVPVGSIAAVAAGAELFHRIRVMPLVDFGLLDQVFVLDRESIPEELLEDLPDASR